MLSGGGIADELAPLAIPSAIDLPLGANLQGHPLLPMSCRTDEASLLGAASAADVDLFQKGSGPLTSNIAEGGLFLSKGDKARNGCLPCLTRNGHGGPAYFRSRTPSC
jgi:choline dehydrogenase